MVFTRDLVEFYHKNDGEIRAFLVSRIGFFDKDIVNDLVQSVYLDLQSNDSLNKYNPNGGMSFSSYIFKIVSWRLRRDAAANKKIQLEVEEITETLQSRLDDYVSFLQNTGASCTGLYEICQYIHLRIDEGKTTREIPYQYYQAHQQGRSNYTLYENYGIFGVTGICHMI